MRVGILEIMVYWLGLAAAGLLYSTHTHSASERANFEVKAECTLQGKVTGSFSFVQKRYTSNTEIKGSVKGLTANQKHGLQIHEGADSAAPGLIYDPFARNHGGPWSVERKVGDLGNLKADAKGEAEFTVSEPFVKLSGPFSVVGRVLAVHEKPDDEGYGRNDESLRTGNVGAVIGAGVITS